jgi:hypothetical protein
MWDVAEAVDGMFSVLGRPLTWRNRNPADWKLLQRRAASMAGTVPVSQARVLYQYQLLYWADGTEANQSLLGIRPIGHYQYCPTKLGRIGSEKFKFLVIRSSSSSSKFGDVGDALPLRALSTT